jgi:chromosome segregation ATPase
MTDEKLEAIYKRIDALNAELAGLVTDVRGLEQSRDQHANALAALRLEVALLRGGQETLAEKVGRVFDAVASLGGQVEAIAKRIPSNAAVVAGGAAAGLPGGVLLVVQAIQWLTGQG